MYEIRVLRTLRIWWLNGMNSSLAIFDLKRIIVWLLVVPGLGEHIIFGTKEGHEKISSLLPAVTDVLSTTLLTKKVKKNTYKLPTK